MIQLNYTQSDASFPIYLADKMASTKSHHRTTNVLDSQQTFIKFKFNRGKPFQPGSSHPFRMLSNPWSSHACLVLLVTANAFVGSINMLERAGCTFLHYSWVLCPISTKVAAPNWDLKPYFSSRAASLIHFTGNKTSYSSAFFLSLLLLFFTFLFQLL